MEQINLTREEVSLCIHSVQRTLIKLEQYNDNSSEIVRQHRMLLKTLLFMERQLVNNKKEKIETYK